MVAAGQLGQPVYSAPALWGVSLLVLSLWPLVGLVSAVPGVACCLVALIRARGVPCWRGRGLAIAGVAVLLPVLVIQAAALKITARKVEERRKQQRIQTIRQKLDQTQADFATIAAALQAYQEANGFLPPTQNGTHEVPPGLTSPVAFLASLPADPFASTPREGYRYASDGIEYVLVARGPDGVWERIEPSDWLIATPGERSRYEYTGFVLDASGDILYFGPQP